MDLWGWVVSLCCGDLNPVAQPCSCPHTNSSSVLMCSIRKGHWIKAKVWICALFCGREQVVCFRGPKDGCNPRVSFSSSAKEPLFQCCSLACAHWVLFPLLEWQRSERERRWLKDGQKASEGEKKRGKKQSFRDPWNKRKSEGRVKWWKDQREGNVCQALCNSCWICPWLWNS